MTLASLGKKKQPLVLVIMDGLGIGNGGQGDAVAKAYTPYLDKIIRASKTSGTYAKMRTDGMLVGLPEGQVGNSEVGHGTIGAGRVLLQSLPRINKAVKDGSLYQNNDLLGLVSRLKQTGGALHLMGLLSDGGVHSHIEHIIATANFAAENGVKVKVHVFADGRDVNAQSCAKYLEKFKVATLGRDVCVATIMGRAIAMERTDNLPIIQKAYNAIIWGEGKHSTDSAESLKADYSAQLAAKGKPDKVNDQDVQPIIMSGFNGAQANDAFLSMNFRADRAIRICRALIEPEVFGCRKKFIQIGDLQFSKENFHIATPYSDELAMLATVLFPKEKVPNCLGEVVSNAGLKQLRLAETEKYAHVTYFFNGDKEEPFPNEERIIIPSPKDGDYANNPEMSSAEVTDKLIEALKSKSYDVIIVNYAQPDMVGHTGSIEAAIKSVEAMDSSLARFIPVIQALNGSAIIISDHGNVEQMLDNKGNPHTSHTNFPVHMMYVGNGRNVRLNKEIEGHEIGLADVAPTILGLLGIDKPAEMTGIEIFCATQRKLGAGSNTKHFH